MNLQDSSSALPVQLQQIPLKPGILERDDIVKGLYNIQNWQPRTAYSKFSQKYPTTHLFTQVKCLYKVWISLKRARKRVCSKKGYHLGSLSYSQDFSLFPEMWFKTRFSLTELEALLMDFRGSSAWREGGEREAEVRGDGD